jgi:hypothetical protein
MIIWIASYPKSGNTLIRSMLSSYLFNKEGKFDFDLLPNIKQFPNWGYFEKLGIDIKDHNEIIKNSIRAQELFNKKESVGFVKTHNMLFNFNKKYPFTNLDNTMGVIYIVRDPRNVILSYSNHLDTSVEQTTKFVTKGKSIDMFFMGNWSENYLSWKSFREYNKYLLIKYEDLISKREETFLKILKFIFKLRNLNIPIDQNKLNNVLKTTSFDYLKNLEMKKNFTESTKNKEGKKIPFFDKGAKRNWSEVLSKDILEKIENSLKKEMIELGYL